MATVDFNYSNCFRAGNLYIQKYLIGGKHCRGCSREIFIMVVEYSCSTEGAFNFLAVSETRPQLFLLLLGKRKMSNLHSY